MSKKGYKKDIVNIMKDGEELKEAIKAIKKTAKIMVESGIEGVPKRPQVASCEASDLCFN